MGIGDISSVKWFGLSDDIINANYVLGGVGIYLHRRDETCILFQ